MTCLVTGGESAALPIPTWTGVGEYFDNEPAVEAIARHGIGRQIHHIERVCAKVRLRVGTVLPRHSTTRVRTQ
jgi:hypothetical protein